MAQYTGGFNTELNGDAVHTAIDEAMYERYSREEQPAYLSATDGMFFKQGSTVGNAFIWDEQSNVGAFDKAGDQEDWNNTDVLVGNQKTKLSQKYFKQIPISAEAFKADRISLRAEIGSQVGDRARLTQDWEACKSTYADAFAGSVNTTPDGQALASNSHTTLKGYSVDNLETGSLTPDNLWTAVTSLANQKAQDGDPGSHIFEGLVVPFTLYKTAREVLNSQLAPNSAENNLNIFDTDYGSVAIKASVYLGSTYNTATNANTSYHLISRNHMIQRKVFYGLTTNLVEPKYSSNDSWVLKVSFHETSFPGSWTGYVGSNGTT